MINLLLMSKRNEEMNRENKQALTAELIRLHELGLEEQKATDERFEADFEVDVGGWPDDWPLDEEDEMSDETIHSFVVSPEPGDESFEEQILAEGEDIDNFQEGFFWK